MSREYARMRVNIWIDDEDFRDLTRDAQHLYFVLLTSPDLSYCGVTDWRPGRLAARARGWTAEQVRETAQELIQRLYIVVDEDTEEVLIRSFVRHDGVMKEARIAVSMVKAFGAVASNTLRGVIVHELQRLHDEDELIEEPAKRMKGWLTVKGEPGQALSLLSLRAIDPASLVDPLPHGLGDDLPLPLGVGLDEGLGVGLAQTPDGVSGSVSGSTSPAPTPAPDPPTKEGQRGVRVRDDFAPNASNREWARGLRFTDPAIDAITEEFVDFWRGKPGKDGLKLDWQATWRNWVRKQDVAAWNKRARPLAAVDNAIPEWMRV